MVEGVEGKRISIFLFFIISFDFYFTCWLLCYMYAACIDPHEEAAIYRVWRTRAEKRLHDMFHDIRMKDASTHWLTDEIL